MNSAANHDERIAKMTFGSVYPHYLAKVEKKGRTEAELQQVIRWLTGFSPAALKKHITQKTTFEQFFRDATLNPKASAITGTICGYRIEDIANPLTQQVRYLDKLVDELAKGRPMEKILRRDVTSRGVALLVAIIAVVSLSACSPAPAPSSGANTDAIAKTLTALDEEWSQAAATRDAERVASFYADDAIAYPPNEQIAIGRPIAKNVWASYFADPTFSISWRTTRAGAAGSGDLGFTAGTYEDAFTRPDGITVRETGKYLCLWQKQPDGRWKAIHDMWNTDSK